MIATVTAKLPGFLLCSLIAFLAIFITHFYSIPVMLVALMLGLICHFIYVQPSAQAGVNFCSRELLRICVALLGVRIAFSDIVALGLTPPIIVIVSMAITIIFGVLFAKLLRLPKEFGVLSGGAVAVCGVSAAAAISTVLPKDKSQEKYFALTVIGITTFSTLSMIFYPLLSSYLGLTEELAGVFIGGAIHDVAQVVGAGYSISEGTGDIATYIKLLRVALLMPVVMLIYISFNRGKSELNAGVSTFIPSFLILFFVLAFVKNVGLIPDNYVNNINWLSKHLLIVAIAGIGLKTSLQQVISVGWKPVLLMGTETLLLASLILFGIMIFY